MPSVSRLSAWRLRSNRHSFSFERVGLRVVIQPRHPDHRVYSYYAHNLSTPAVEKAIESDRAQALLLQVIRVGDAVGFQ
jgi:hypothetical protein